MADLERRLAEVRAALLRARAKLQRLEELRDQAEYEVGYLEGQVALLEELTQEEESDAGEGSDLHFPRAGDDER